MRISDWSSDVCSSDLNFTAVGKPQCLGAAVLSVILVADDFLRIFSKQEMQAAVFQRFLQHAAGGQIELAIHQDRKSVVSGKSVSVRVDLGGRRFIKHKHITTTTSPRDRS